MNKEDYIIEGIVAKFIASEALRFGEYVDYAYLGNRLGVKRAAYPRIEHEHAGRIISAGNEGDQVDVLMSGHIIPREHETEYRQQLKHGFMLSVFSCIGDMFGYNVTVKKHDSSEQSITEEEKR